jgi:hypothetical protein
MGACVVLRRGGKGSQVKSEGLQAGKAHNTWACREEWVWETNKKEQRMERQPQKGGQERQDMVNEERGQMKGDWCPLGWGSKCLHAALTVRRQQRRVSLLRCPWRDISVGTTSTTPASL